MSMMSKRARLRASTLNKIEWLVGCLVLLLVFGFLVHLGKPAEPSPQQNYRGCRAVEPAHSDLGWWRYCLSEKPGGGSWPTVRAVLAANHQFVRGGLSQLQSALSQFQPALSQFGDHR